MAEQNQERRNTAGEVRNKAVQSHGFTPEQGQIELVIPTKSEAVKRYMMYWGDRTSAAMIRVGTLLKITILNGDQENYSKIMVWIEDMIAQIKNEVREVKSMVDECSKLAELDGIELPKLIVGDADKTWKCYSNHPAMVKLLRELAKIDDMAIMVDRLWFGGMMDDKQKAQSGKQLLHPFYISIDMIARVTDVGGRTGSRYSPDDFLALLRKEVSVAAFIQKYIQKNATGDEKEIAVGDLNVQIEHMESEAEAANVE